MSPPCCRQDADNPNCACSRTPAHDGRESIAAGIAAHLERVARALTTIDMAAVTSLVKQLQEARDRRALIMIAGNGGSAALASHMAADLQSLGIRAVSLSADASRITCIGNDYGFEHVFSHQVDALGGLADMLIVISASGNSPNIIEALANARHQMTVAIIGQRRSGAWNIADTSIVTGGGLEPLDYEVAEDVTSALIHAVKVELRKDFVP